LTHPLLHWVVGTVPGAPLAHWSKVTTLTPAAVAAAEPSTDPEIARRSIAPPIKTRRERRTSFSFRLDPQIKKHNCRASGG
jgi:hypothetical protein